MSKNKEITVHCIAQTRVNCSEMQQWLRDLGVSKDFEIPTGVTDADVVCGVAGKQCYMSFEVGMNPNIQKIRTDWITYLDNVLSSGHGSVTEHCTWTFAINNVTRVFTGEMNRHRAGVAISERSMRFIRPRELFWWMPLCFRDNPNDNTDLATCKSISRQIFQETFDFIEEKHAQLAAIWDLDSTDKNFHYKKVVTSALRRILGMGTCTGGVWTFNARALRHMLTMRASAAAEEEICLVATMIGKIMFETEKGIFGDFEQVAGGFWVPKYLKV